MFENPRRVRQARNFTTNVPKILVLKSSSEQIFSRKLPLGAPASGLHSLHSAQSFFYFSPGFRYLLCWPPGRRIGLVCTRRFSFHEFYNFLLIKFLIFISFWKTVFYPRHLPTPTPTPTTHDPRHLATLAQTWEVCIRPNFSGSR